MGSKSFGNYCFYKRRQIKTIEPKDKKLAPPAGLEPATYGLTVRTYLVNTLKKNFLLFQRQFSIHKVCG